MYIKSKQKNAQLLLHQKDSDKLSEQNKLSTHAVLLNNMFFQKLIDLAEQC